MNTNKPTPLLKKRGTLNDRRLLELTKSTDRIVGLFNMDQQII